MHVRFTTARGFPVVEDRTYELVGTISGILIHPDNGKVEGFFVDDLFLSTIDILRWSTNVVVRSAEVLAPMTDFVRLESMFADPRTVLDQHVRTKSGRDLGRCKDVQFDTRKWHVEWLYPQKWFQWGTPISIADVLEVKRDAIIVRDSVVPARKEEPAVDVIENISEVAEEVIAGPSTS